MNLLDSIVSAFNPRAGLQRALARKALRSFEAASRSRRTDGWRTSSSDANREIGQGQQLLRDRARAMRRDNPYAERGISAIASNVVGYGIVPDPQGRTRQKRHALKMWKAWAETPACDAAGMSGFYGLQNLAMQSVAESGEVLLRRVWTPGANALNFQVQMLEADYLDDSKNMALGDGGYIELGIEYNSAGVRTHFWLFPQHPGGTTKSLRSGVVSERVPAEDVAHIFLRKRPGQTRGYSWMAPVILRMRNFDEMEDAVIEQAKIAACFAAIIQEDEGGSGGASPTKPSLIERMEPGMIERIGAGESVQFGTPPTFNGYEAYSRQSLRATAVGLGLPYEVLAGDLSGVNFTSGRMGWLEFGRNIDVWRWHMLIPQMCARVWDWFNEAASVSPGGWETAIPCGWVAPRRDLIDPTKELDALSREMRIGALSFSGMLKERGINDTDAHISQMVEDNAAIDKAGLVLDSDPRKVASQGMMQPATAPAADIAPGADADTLAASRGSA
jgi:lambda family phage portal protein